MSESSSDLAQSARVLLGGVPFGCHNVGDEAIVECSVRLVQGLAPAAKVTVATGDPDYFRGWPGVETCPLLGFDPAVDRAAVRSILGRHDLFLWCSATGLSDYPEVPLRLLNEARSLGLRTGLWAVGMNSQLNPAIYGLGSGRRARVLHTLSALTLGLVDFVELEHRRRESRVRRLIRRGLEGANLVVLRDPESLGEVRKCGVTREVFVGSDPALTLEPVPIEGLTLASEVRDVLASPHRKVGLCISTSAPAFQGPDRLVGYMDSLVQADDLRLVLVPMDPRGDADLLAELRGKMKHPERAVLVAGSYKPAEILSILALLDVVVSSRLHMLILASTVGVPIVGISPGTKMDNFMRPFGLSPAGMVTDCDFGRLASETRRMLEEREEFQGRCEQVMADLNARLESPRARLLELLSSAAAQPRGAGRRASLEERARPARRSIGSASATPVGSLRPGACVRPRGRRAPRS